MVKTDTKFADKSLSKESNTNTNTLAAEAADLVRKVKRHIEQDGCICCKEALSSP